MKKILFILLLLPLFSAAQKPVLTAGDELIKAKNHFYLGFGMQTAGLLIISGNAYADDTDNRKMARIVGGSISFIGFILTIESFSHIGKAGKKLNQQKIGLLINDAGIGIRFTL